MPQLSFDYSKFDNIVDSDDEKDHHPNLDRGLNQRVIRITRDRKEDEIDTQQKTLIEEGKLDEAEKLERQRPLHVGNMCKVAEERTIINSTTGRKDRLVKGGEAFPVDEYADFKKDNMALLNEFVEADWEKSNALLAEHGDELLDECANGYFMLTALDQEMKGNTKQVEKLVHQGQIVSQIRQLAEAMKRPPRDFVNRFFQSFQSPAGKITFQQGVDNFMEHIRRRAKEKKEEEEQAEQESAPVEAQMMDAEAAAAQKAVPLVDIMYKMKPAMRKSLAPKGLDPVEVYEKLPEELKAAFKASSTDLLKKAAEKMNQAEFERHFQLCIDSGLWEEELNAFVHVSQG